ncbi:hypothetical protein [Streptomyces cavernicola]|uniref:Uncharacterized protein n=1 Tax=Streptomyces cavernicola TaxID=3043613 RepID=A0ABT6SBS0_9ACTN|nr:hypothetical protein [Streptomyces sp. B-S-A6]MDI3405642.1 hypothetical protein [Streptomyces sp. B-S-A6]
MHRIGCGGRTRCFHHPGASRGIEKSGGRQVGQHSAAIEEFTETTGLHGVHGKPLGGILRRFCDQRTEGVLCVVAEPVVTMQYANVT